MKTSFEMDTQELVAVLEVLKELVKEVRKNSDASSRSNALGDAIRSLTNANHD